MDDQSKRMLLLGRQAPPKELDLRLEPRTHVSPHHAPVADVVYRVEKHLSITSPGDHQQPQESPHQRTDIAQVEQAKLSNFQKQVKLRAAHVQKDMRSASMQWQKEKQMKRDCLTRRQEYARKVAANNILKSSRVHDAISVECSSDDDSEDSLRSGIGPDGVSRHTEYRCRSSPSASPSRTPIESMTEQTASYYGSLNHFEVNRSADTNSKRWASPVRTGKWVPLPGGQKACAPVETSKYGVPDRADLNCIDKPVPPPANVTAQIHAWKKQEQLYRGAACPCVASDDPHLSLSGLNDGADLEPMPACDEKARDPTAQKPVDPEPELQATDFLSLRDIARRSLLRHCSPSRHTCTPCGSAEHRPSLLTPLGTFPNTSTTSGPASLDRIAGGGTGLPEVQLCPGLGSEAMQHAASESLPDTSPKIKDVHGACAQIDHAPTVRVSRHNGSAVVTGARDSRRPENRVLSVSMLARLEDKVKHMNLSLPQLCACHSVPVLDPRYISHCACNCPFYHNDGLYFEMLYGLLQAYGVTV